MFEKNIRYVSHFKTSPWRKVAANMWRRPNDPTVYAMVDIDATRLLQRVQSFKEQSIPVTPTVIVARALALCIQDFPVINCIIRWGKLYQRRDINIFLQVSNSSDADDLSGIMVEKCDQKNLTQLAQEIKKNSMAVKGGQDVMYGKMKGMLSILPAFLLRPLLKFTDFLLYPLNLWHPILGVPKDSMGSAMVTSVGMMGIERGFAPIVGVGHCPMLLTVGKIAPQAVVRDGKIEIRSMLPIGITLDHRLMDGKGGSKMLLSFRRYLEEMPE